MLALGCSNDHNMLGNVAFTVILEGSMGLILPKALCQTAMLSRSSAIMALDEYRRWKKRKCIAVAFVLCHLENTPSHINKNRELRQRGRERQRECYKTIDSNYRIQSLSCENATIWLIGHRRTKEMLAYVGQKVWLVSNWTQHMPTSCNIVQHGVQMNATCCAQHVGTTCCVRLQGP